MPPDTTASVRVHTTVSNGIEIRENPKPLIACANAASEKTATTQTHAGAASGDAMVASDSAPLR